jgi:hypothetical protein
MSLSSNQSVLTNKNMSHLENIGILSYVFGYKECNVSFFYRLNSGGQSIFINPAKMVLCTIILFSISN